MLQAIPARHATMLLPVVVVEFLDFATFIPAVARVGIGDETNPFARALYLSSGAAGLAVMKVIGTTVILLALLWIARRFPTRLLPAALMASALGFAGFASNVLSGLVG